MADLAGKVENPTIHLTQEHTRLLREGGLELFAALLDQSATAAALSARLSLPRARVNFILNRLLADGLVMVDGERSDGERVERTYRAQVTSFGIRAGGDSPVRERIAAATFVTDRLHSGLMRAMSLEQKNMAIHMARARVPQERLTEYFRRLGELQAEFDAEAGFGDDPWYAMAIALYPEAGEPEGGSTA